MTKQLEKKHPLAIRWLHWINFPLLTLMIWSGLLIYWANPIYGLKIFGYELFHFFPSWFYEISKIDFWGLMIPDYLPAWAYEWSNIPFRLAEGLSLHFFFMWFFAANGVIYVLYLIFSGEWRAILPVPGSFKRAALVTLHDLRIVKKLPPQGKYNDAQRIAYTGVILMGAGSVLTGLAIHKPLQLAWLTSLLGGYEWARWMHFWLTIFFVLFFVVHVAQVVIAGWGNFRSIITGYDIVDSASPAEPIVEEEKNGMSEEDNEVLVEKVREIEKAKREKEKLATVRSANTAAILKEKRELGPPLDEKQAKRQMFKRSRRTFLIGGATAVLGGLGYYWLRKPDNFYLFERMFRFNENVSQAFFEASDLAPEFPRELASARVNGFIGLNEEFDRETWQLQVTGLSNPQLFPQFSESISFPGDNAPRSMDTPPEPNTSVPGLLFSLDEIKSLPRVEMTTELKCIEGWSVISNWTGVRFSDFAAQFFPVLRQGEAPNLQNLPENLTQYVSLVTPDRAYYVGWDMQSILHPQTLLAYEMNGEPLKPEHGAPLRLVTTAKYGIKQIKRIGRIEFTNERPADYWAREGYDWYSGL